MTPVLSFWLSLLNILSGRAEVCQKNDSLLRIVQSLSNPLYGQQQQKKSDLFMKCLYKEQMAKTFIIMVYSLVFYRGMDRKKAKNF